LNSSSRKRNAMEHKQKNDIERSVLRKNVRLVLKLDREHQLLRTNIKRVNYSTVSSQNTVFTHQPAFLCVCLYNMCNA